MDVIYAKIAEMGHVGNFHLMELYDMICDLELNEPKDKRKKEWKEWKKILNLLMIEYNNKLQVKLYKLIK
jgi:gentisate 1,2-dioxygenase